MKLRYKGWMNLAEPILQNLICGVIVVEKKIISRLYILMKKHAAAIMHKNFYPDKGFLQSDAYSGYNWIDRNNEIISVGCHAHARRPFAELVKIAQAPGLAHQAITFYRKLYAVEDEARKKNLSVAARYELRQKSSVPVLEAFKKWLDHQLTKTSEHGKIGKAIRYCLSNWIELTNYLKDGRIEIDNNLRS